MYAPLDYEALSARVIALLAKGMGLRKVARALGISKSSAARLRDWGRGCLLPRKRYSNGRRNVTPMSDMIARGEIRNKQRRASMLFIEDLRREHPEREI